MTTIYASLAGSVAIVPLYLAATAGWHRLIDWHDQHTDRPSPTPIQTRRQPIAAITATPHFPFVDEHLGPLNLGPLEPAHIHDQLIGATR